MKRFRRYLCDRYGHKIIRDWCGESFACLETCPRCGYHGAIKWRKPRSGLFWRMFEGG